MWRAFWDAVFAVASTLAAVLFGAALKRDGMVRKRSLKAASRAFPVVVALWIAATAATVAVAPDLFAGLAARPVAWLATALFLASLSGSSAGAEGLKAGLLSWPVGLLLALVLVLVLFRLHRGKVQVADEEGY